MSRQKVMDIQLDGFHIQCIRINQKGEYNPFRVYRVYGNHRRQIAKYGDFMSVLYFVRDIFLYGLDVLPLQDLLQWVHETKSI